MTNESYWNGIDSEAVQALEFLDSVIDKFSFDHKAIAKKNANIGVPLRDPNYESHIHRHILLSSDRRQSEPLNKQNQGVFIDSRGDVKNVPFAKHIVRNHRFSVEDYVERNHAADTGVSENGLYVECYERKPNDLYAKNNINIFKKPNLAENKDVVLGTSETGDNIKRMKAKLLNRNPLNNSAVKYNNSNSVDKTITFNDKNLPVYKQMSSSFVDLTNDCSSPKNLKQNDYNKELFLKQHVSCESNLHVAQMKNPNLVHGVQSPQFVRPIKTVASEDECSKEEKCHSCVNICLKTQGTDPDQSNSKFSSLSINDLNSSVSASAPVSADSTRNINSHWHSECLSDPSIHQMGKKSSKAPLKVHSKPSYLNTNNLHSSSVDAVHSKSHSEANLIVMEHNIKETTPRFRFVPMLFENMPLRKAVPMTKHLRKEEITAAKQPNCSEQNASNAEIKRNDQLKYPKATEDDMYAKVQKTYFNKNDSADKSRINRKQNMNNLSVQMHANASNDPGTYANTDTHLNEMSKHYIANKRGTQNTKSNPMYFECVKEYALKDNQNCIRSDMQAKYCSHQVAFDRKPLNVQQNTQETLQKGKRRDGVKQDMKIRRLNQIPPAHEKDPRMTDGSGGNGNKRLITPENRYVPFCYADNSSCSYPVFTSSFIGTTSKLNSKIYDAAHNSKGKTNGALPDKQRERQDSEKPVYIEVVSRPFKKDSVSHYPAERNKINHGLNKMRRHVIAANNHHKKRVEDKLTSEYMRTMHHLGKGSAPNTRVTTVKQSNGNRYYVEETDSIEYQTRL